MVYSSNAVTREQVRLALGSRIHPELPELTYTEVATGPMVISLMDAGGFDLVILDGEASPVGGMGIAKQLKDEITGCPPVLLLTGHLDLTGCMALGMTGAVLRSTGLPHDLRKSQPYCGYETYDFDVVTDTGADCYGRYLIRIGEMRESLRIVEQCLQRLEPGPVMISDKKLAWPADLQLGPDGLGNSPQHIAKIMGTSMEGLIHHFKLVTEGIRVPAGQVYTAVESPRGELGVHMVSDGGTRPYRVHYRDPSFTNLQAVAAMCEGGMVADVIAAVASIDPVMGGVDR
jgi:NADH-quinone oxidoreductase subunit D